MDGIRSDEKPDWWRRNARLREEMELPRYDPPRFRDGVYTHSVVPELEQRYGCSIRFVGINTAYLDAWEVRVDGTTAFTVERRRDENGNTVYLLDAEEFVTRLESTLRDSRGAGSSS